MFINSIIIFIFFNELIKISGTLAEFIPNRTKTEKSILYRNGLRSSVSSFTHIIKISREH